MIVLLLVVVWGGVGVWWYMSRPEAHSTDSIGSFRQQLRVLERTGPTTVRPAYRMESRDLGVYGASKVPTLSAPGRALANNPSLAAARRRRLQKRRRDVFYGLSASVVGSVVLGFLPGLSVMWALAALLLAVEALYVVVLVQLKAAAAPQKVRYLPVAMQDAEPALLMQRSAAN